MSQRRTASSQGQIPLLVSVGKHCGPSRWWRWTASAALSAHHIWHSFNTRISMFSLDMVNIATSFCGSSFPSLWLSRDLDICPVKHFAHEKNQQHTWTQPFGVARCHAVMESTQWGGVRVNQTRQHRGLMLHLVTLPLPYITPQAIDLQMESQE